MDDRHPRSPEEIHTEYELRNTALLQAVRGLAPELSPRLRCALPALMSSVIGREIRPFRDGQRVNIRETDIAEYLGKYATDPLYVIRRQNRWLGVPLDAAAEAEVWEGSASPTDRAHALLELNALADRHLYHATPLSFVGEREVEYLFEHDALEWSDTEQASRFDVRRSDATLPTSHLLLRAKLRGVELASARAAYLEDAKEHVRAARTSGPGLTPRALEAEASATDGFRWAERVLLERTVHALAHEVYGMLAQTGLERDGFPEASLVAQLCLQEAGIRSRLHEGISQGYHHLWFDVDATYGHGEFGERGRWLLDLFAEVESRKYVPVITELPYSPATSPSQYDAGLSTYPTNILTGTAAATPVSYQVVGGVVNQFRGLRFPELTEAALEVEERAMDDGVSTISIAGEAVKDLRARISRLHELKERRLSRGLPSVSIDEAADALTIEDVTPPGEGSEHGG